MGFILWIPFIFSPRYIYCRLYIRALRVSEYSTLPYVTKKTVVGFFCLILANVIFAKIINRNCQKIIMAFSWRTHWTICDQKSKMTTKRHSETLTFEIFEA